MEMSPPQRKLSYYLLVLSQGISLIGGEVLFFAISLHVLDLTGSAEIFATMMAVSFLPRIFFTPLGGAIADRFPKKIILVITDSVNALLVGMLAVLLFGGSQSVILLGAIVTLMTLIGTCYHPTVTASLPAILEKDELVKANGLVQGVKAISRLLGPVMAGFLFAGIGVNALVGLCAGFFLFSAIINVFIKIPYTPREMAGRVIGAVLADLKEGFVYMAKKNPLLLRAAVIFTTVTFFYQAMLAIAFPYMIRITFAMGDEVFGFANAAIGVAVLVGGFAAGKMKNSMQIKHLPAYIFLIGLVTVPIGVSLLLSREGIMPFLMMVGGFMLIMFVFTLVNILVMAYTQANVPEQMVGKATAIFVSLAISSAPVGLMLFGWVLEGLGDRQFVLYLVVAGVTVVMGLVARKWLVDRKGEQNYV